MKFVVKSLSWTNFRHDLCRMYERNIENMKSLKDTIELNNGYGIPCVGFGTFLSDGPAAYESVISALNAGYRHIDTAAVYKNEEDVGRAVRESGIPRDEIFVTTKLWNDDQGYGQTLKAFETSLGKLGMDYVDLYLIHWPRIKRAPEDWARLNRESWKAMEELYAAGKIKALGVSNFKPHHLQSLMEAAVVKPAVNQIELHPGLLQGDTVAFCEKNGIVVEAWGPFSRGKLLQAGLLDDIAVKYNKTPAQVCLRWHLQKGVVPLPKSVTPLRIKENADIFDFSLSADDMERISNIEQDTGTGYDPDTVAW